MSDPSIDVFRNPEVMIGNGCQQRLMSDAKHLSMLSQDVKQLRHRAADPTADTGINFIKKQGA